MIQVNQYDPMFYRQCLKKVAVFLPLLCVSLTHCRSREKPGIDEFVDGTGEKFLPDESAPLPEALWSQSRRESTAGYYFLLAEDLSLRGDKESARKMYTQAYLLDANALLASKMIESEAVSGDMNQAGIDAERMALLYPQSAELKFLHARILASQGFVQKAVEEMEGAIQLSPESEEFYLGLAAIYLAEKKPKKAIVTLKKLIDQRPLSISGLVLIARLYLASGQAKLALEPAKRAYEMQTNNAETIVVYALALEQNKMTQKALALYELLYKMSDSSGPILERMAELYESIGNLEESLELLKELRNNSQASKEAIDQQIAIVLWGLNRYPEAAELLENLHKRVPANDRVAYMAGIALERVDLRDKAKSILESISQESLFFVPAAIHRAYMAADLKDFSQAEGLLNEALKKDPNSEEALLILASLKSDQGQNKEAAKILQKAFADNPEKTKLLFYSAVYLERNDERDNCIRLLRQVLKIEPDMSAALNFLAYLLVEKDDVLEGRALNESRISEALNLANLALALKPGDGFYLDTRAWVYFRQKQYEKALSELSKALDKNPDEGVIIEHVGDVYKTMNENNKAYEKYKEALGVKLEERDRPRIEKKLELLKPLVKKEN